MHKKFWGPLLALLPSAALADVDPFSMFSVQTKDAQIIYYDSLGFLVPRAVRTLTNSLEFQRKTFGWEPSDRITVRLRDFADYGNAYALPAPNNQVIFDLAPGSHAFETGSGTERLYTNMNHELVHLVQGDMETDADRFWRKIFLGKVSVQSDYPETLLYNYLTVPRFVSPRWYIEGGAVFMETWMSGGLGRAQSGYDEMVFRAMVRDHVKFYDPLGLVSKGVRVDFQTGANAYLYGTRFISFLAYQYSPEQVVSWIERGSANLPANPGFYRTDAFYQLT